MFSPLAAGRSCEWDHCLGLCLPWLNRRWHGSSPQLYTIIFFTGFGECDWSSFSSGIFRALFVVYFHAESFRFSVQHQEDLCGEGEHSDLMQVSFSSHQQSFSWELRCGYFVGQTCRVHGVGVCLAYVNIQPPSRYRGRVWGLFGLSVLTGCG